MTTGKIEFAPDYKSRLGLMGKQTATDIRDALRADKRDAERTRLERQLVEAAKAWRHDKTFKSDKKLFAAVDALESFEAKQKK